MRWNGEERVGLVDRAGARGARSRWRPSARCSHGWSSLAAAASRARGPKTERPYLLRGRLTCGLCGRKLQGSWHHGEAYYRCQYGAEYAKSAQLAAPEGRLPPRARPAPPPRRLAGAAVRPGATSTPPARRSSALPPRPALARRAAAANDQLRECDRKLDRYRAAPRGRHRPRHRRRLDQGRAGRAHRGAQATLDALDGAQRADVDTAADVREAIEHLGGLVGLLQVSDAKLRSRFYEEVGVLGTYLPDSRSVDIEADPCVRKVRVGGGT